MKLDWDKLRTAVERSLNSAKKGERGSMRVHCKSAERMLKGAKDDTAKQILDSVHHASTSIDMTKAVEHLEKAHSLSNPA